MDITTVEPYRLLNLTSLNILLGKNGCGKSTVLRDLDRSLGRDDYQVSYVTPERGGTLKYEPNLETNVRNNPQWMSDQRRANQFTQFREQVVGQFQRLELLVHRELESLVRSKVYDGQQLEEKTFDQYVDRINKLLDNIEIARSSQRGVGFDIFKRGTKQPVPPERVSSGEAEIISIAIECLAFEKEMDASKTNLLLLDSPDVHLHPDLQSSLAHFLRELARKQNVIVLIATHSTALVGGFRECADAAVEFMVTGQTEFTFEHTSSILKRILPIFGAHPLSNFFNESPTLLVEGDDEERIWQQVVRSSEGRIKLNPCSVGGKSNLNAYETQVREIIQSVYDAATAYSLRDRDDDPEEIGDLAPVTRFRLSCRASENLLLSNEVLEILGTTWEEMRKGLDEWLDKNPAHKHFETMRKFKDAGYDRKRFDIKELRNDLMGVFACPKPWEVVIGQTIARQDWSNAINFDDEGSLACFLGRKLINAILTEKMAAEPVKQDSNELPLAAAASSES
jgi:energy-coupling factor transporter ATP-binding protein EcfA2